MPDGKLLARKRAPMKRLIAAGCTLTLCLSAICAYVMYDAGLRDYEEARVASSNLVATLAADVARNIEKIDLSLQAVQDGLKLPEVNRLDPAMRNMVLFDRSTTSSDMGSILAIDRHGNIKVESRSLTPRPDNYSQKEYFQYHLHNADDRLYVTRPYVNHLGAYIIGVSRRLVDSAGNFDGVVVGVIKVSYFYDLFKKIQMAPGDSLTITRSDATVLMRFPFDISSIGRVLSNSRINEAFKKTPSGIFDGVSTSDGVYRLFAYQQAGDLPLIVSVGRSIDSIYANWRLQAWVIGSMVAALCAFNLALIVFLARSLRQRADAEFELARMATTDALTGLANRRRFDKVIQSEWNRMRRAGQPLALLMIDADYFKAYNDRHGHQAGDKALAAIADRIASAICRASEFSARFGGEEFAVVLPGESIAGALAIAERIRANINSLRGQQSSQPDVTPTISIGVASVMPQAGLTPEDLIKRADLALYQAKDRGRDFSFAAAPAVATVANLAA